MLTLLEDSFLEDLNSANGTLVNGKGIGKHELRYVNNSKRADVDFEKTVFIGARNQPRVESAALAQNKNLDRARLQIRNGKSSGKELPLEKDSVKLGRPGIQVVLIKHRADGHFIMALDQAEQCPPLRVNGTEIGSRSVKLQNHDVIEINQLKIEYYLAS